MSISPNSSKSVHLSSSSLTDPLSNPNSRHGIDRRLPQFEPHQIGRGHARARRGGARKEHVAGGRETAGSVIAVSGGSPDSSKNVADHRSPYGRKGSFDLKNGTAARHRPSVLGGISSQFGSDQSEVQSNRQQSESGKFVQSDPSSSGSTGLQSTAAQPALRRNQAGNANHLLNFYYDPISRPPPRAAPPPRRQQKIKPYNKDLFLQANFKFVLLDTGSYKIESMDPDKMLHWEDIICVRYSTPYPVQCPICLEAPLCPQITSCGHIYCFPCILQYLLMGKEDHKGDCWKKCPLCFMMISSKDLCTIQIENVKQFHVGESAHFTLLTRPKDSLVPSLKNQDGGPTSYGSDCIYDTFSKFTLTLDVELSLREAKSNLNSWLIKAETGHVDDLERLPYVCAALQQLEERLKIWMDLLTVIGSPPPRKSATTLSNFKDTGSPDKGDSILLASTSSTSNHDNSAAAESGGRTLDSGLKHETLGEGSSTVMSHVPESCESPEKDILVDDDKGPLSSWKDAGERESYTFYQAVDGQHLILHPLNMKCLLHHYGSYDLLPPRLSGQILEMEMLTQSEAIRKRYRYLSHLSLTTTIQLCEIDMGEILPPSSLAPFKDEIYKREKQRKQLARKEENGKARAEAAALHALPILYDPNYFPHKDPTFSSDDFEALGSGVVPSTSPPISNERKKFSDVTRLGFAAAHDSPSLKLEGPSDISGNMGKKGGTSNSQGSRPMAPLSFANVMSAPKAMETPPSQNANGSGKKGKKPTKVLLSTAGGRRY